MKDRTGECWHMPSDTTQGLTDAYLVVVNSDLGKGGNHFVHTFVITHGTGKFEFRTMREWSRLSLESFNYTKLG